MKGMMDEASERPLLITSMAAKLSGYEDGLSGPFVAPQNRCGYYGQILRAWRK